MIYHHIIVSIYFLHISKGSNWYELLFYAEVSNLPSQIVYYYIQKEKQGIKHNIKLKLLKLVQLYVYGFFRVIVASYYMFYEFQHVYYTEPHYGDFYFYLSIPLYIMGLIWTLILYKNYNLENKIK
jgi:hypothetical protein